MKNINLQLDESVFSETERILSETKADRNRYISEALVHYNRYQKRRLLAQHLKEESTLVSEESMRVLAEFENLSDADSSI